MAAMAACRGEFMLTVEGDMPVEAWADVVAVKGKELKVLSSPAGLAAGKKSGRVCCGQARAEGSAARCRIVRVRVSYSALKGVWMLRFALHLVICSSSHITYLFF